MASHKLTECLWHTAFCKLVIKQQAHCILWALVIAAVQRYNGQLLVHWVSYYACCGLTLAEALGDSICDWLFACASGAEKQNKQRVSAEGVRNKRS